MPDANNLHASDFSIESPDWIPTLRAVVRFRGADASLVIDGTQRVLSVHANLLSELLGGWSARLQEIAKQTEDYLQGFLPGREVIASELGLWSVTLYTDEGTPNSGCFFYRVGGEYNSPTYNLEQFDHASVVELCVSVDGGIINWGKRELSTTNDFD